MKLGDRVRKRKGYPFPGVIVGCLHIYIPEQLELNNDT